jgi:hypothetical protein
MPAPDYRSAHRDVVELTIELARRLDRADPL